MHYGLFVTYFPHLIAGPMLHHAQMMPQFARVRRPTASTAPTSSLGLTIFAMGLFKKVVLADGIAPYADAVFEPADAGGGCRQLPRPGSVRWPTRFQIYFDFSGYSDMAIGLSWMFSVRLPLNFNSPYKARNIIDFWRRWHITLSPFLRDYLYIPLGGNRKGPVRRYLNLGLTMLLGGLWHGAGWTFVIWGALHGLYLMLNHGFRAVTGRARLAPGPGCKQALASVAWCLTFLAVVLAWVFFRAETLPGALRMLEGMAGAAPPGTDAGLLLWNAGLKPDVGLAWCAALGAIAVFGRNSNCLGEALRSRLQTGAALAADCGAARSAWPVCWSWSTRHEIR